MKTIHKFSIPTDRAAIQDGFSLDMPEDAEILSVQLQRGEPMLWALIDTAKTLRRRRFVLVMTGERAYDHVGSSTHRGTLQLQGGEFVLHLFEI